MTGRYRYLIAAMLFFAAVINYVDRSSIGIVAPMVSKELHLNHTQMGEVFTAFFIGFSLFGIVGGYLADRFGAWKLYGISMAAWSLLCGSTIFARGLSSLIGIRFLFGLAEGPQVSLTVKTVQNWFPREEAGLMIGTVMNAGNMLGAAVSGPLVGLLAISFGWRWAFIVITVLGLIWVLPWMIFSANRAVDSNRVSLAEKILVTKSHEIAETSEKERSLLYYLFSPVVLAISAAFFASQYMNFLLLSWLPTYLVTTRHLDLHNMSLAIVVPWVLAAAGAVLGGAFSDWMFRRTGDAITWRKYVGVGALLVSAACMACADDVGSVGVAIFVLGIGSFTLHMVPSTCWVLVAETVPRGRVGFVTGYGAMIGNISGAISPLVSGIIVTRTGSFGLSFDLAAAVAVMGALALLLLVRGRKTGSFSLREQQV